MKCLVAAFLAITGVLWAQPADENLAPNPGFETLTDDGKPQAWQLPAPVFSIVKTSPRSGDHCLRYRNDDAERYQLSRAELTLEPGQRYQFQVWVRTQNVQGNDNGATICIEYSDADGAYLGGSYPSGVKGTELEWTLVQGVTNPVPENAASCTVVCYVRKGMTGEAWFDDVSVTPYRPPLIEAVSVDAYRGMYSGGRVTLFAGLTLDQQRLDPDDVVVNATVHDAQGRAVLAVEADQVSANQAVVSFDSESLAPGRYTARVTARTQDGTRTASQEVTMERVESLPERTVWIDDHGRTIVNGEPFFPLGTYWGGITEEHLKRYADSPFNCLMPYGGADMATMDRIEEHGLKIIYSIKDYYAGTKYAPTFIESVEDEKPAVTKTVTKFRDHPALLAWYINDELPVSMIDRLSLHQRWIEELDPNHPSWVVLYQIADVRTYLPTCDVIGTDPYPIPTSPASRALDWTRKTGEATFGTRAIWMVPQIFDWASYKKGDEAKDLRAPTLLEMRSMAWQCIAGGANGLIFYSWFDLWRMNEKDPFEKRWSEVTTMADEISRNIPVILSTTPPPALTVSAPESVAWRVWQMESRVYVLLVNSGSESAKAEIKLPFAAGVSECVVGQADLVAAGNRIGVSLGRLEPVMISAPLP